MKGYGMKSRFIIFPLLIGLALIISSPLQADDFLESLQPNQEIHGFSTNCVYENSEGKVTGARFISEKNGFIVDLMLIQSVPQAFYWIKTKPTSSMGEPHACEHLLLGKGNRGRYVAALEDMALSSSSAGTGQIRTMYHFNTVGGEDAFYEIFEAKLMAFLHPDFTDEEIRREVCHIGVNTNPEDSMLSIEEKGTVYTEMVSAYEKPWYHVYKPLNDMIYGANHPLTYSSGGDPDEMRKMVPDDMWKFIGRTHHLNNMGAIVSIPPEMGAEECLEKISQILDRCHDDIAPSRLSGIGAYDMPPINPAGPGTMEIVGYPSDKEEDPGYMLYGYPANLKLGVLEEAELDLFLTTFASGQTSNLYNLLINSQTRRVDLGGNYVYGSYDDDVDISVYFGVVGVDNRNINETMLDSVMSLIVGEIRRIHDLPDSSEELLEFNRQARSRLIERQKEIENYLNSPPMFGFRRGSAGGWLNVLRSLEKEDGFRKSLVFKKQFDVYVASKAS